MHIVFIVFCISKIVGIDMCFGFKQRRLLSIGNSFTCSLENGRNFVMSFWKGIGFRLL